MKRLSLLLLVAACLALACLTYVRGTGAQSPRAPQRLFEPLASDRAPDASHARAQTPAAAAVVREQEIKVNFGEIDFASARELSLPLPGGLSYIAVRSASEGFDASNGGGFLWRGKISAPGGWTGDVTLSAVGRALSGLIYSPEGVYEIVPREDFGHLLVQLDQSRFPACGGTLPQAPDSESARADASAPSPKWATSAADEPTASDDGSVIEVLVVYTSAVKTTLGGATQAEAFAQQAVNITNTAYINSGINTRLHLAGTFEASYTENGTLTSALSWARGDAGVASARNGLKADMVSIIIDNATDGCGLGYVMHTVGSGFAGSAFSAVQRSCAVGNLSFAHELGHNQGCEHNPENGSDPDDASYPYAFGHWVDNSFRTVMSYADPCASGCARVAHFSNPSVNFNGVPTGVADARDNRRVINNTALTVAQFRDSNVAPPPNDNFNAAQTLGGTTGTVSGTNRGATKEPGEPNHVSTNAGGASVWYNWQAPSTGRLTLTTAGSNFDTLLAAYTGSSVGSLSGVASNDDAGGGLTTSSVNFKVTAGTTYRIAVDGWGGDVGNVKLNWNLVPTPANNDFVDAAVIGGNAGSVSGTNVGATKETGEPPHAANAGGASVWYAWTAPSNGSLTLTTAGSSFNTLLAVYNGAAVGSLSAVAANDDAAPGTVTSSVTFNVTSGTTYRIAVDGFNGASGNVTLNWSLGVACTYAVTAPNAVFPGTGGAGSFNVAAPSGCPWTASAGVATWVTFTSAANGSGNGTVNYNVAANPNTSSRLTSVSVTGVNGTAPVFFNVFQEGNVSSTVRLGAAAFAVNEPERKVLINVTRTGDTSGAASVGYATSDGTASRLGDYTQTLGTLNFAPNETTKAVTVFVTDDVLQESPETFNFTLSNASGASLALGSPASAVVTVNSDDAQTGANPVGDTSFDADFFVRQHYVDFLAREADAPGLAHWTNQTTNCGSPDPLVCRINVSAAFFLSIEFQNTGFYAYRTYKAAYGDTVDLANGLFVPPIRLDEFLNDTRRIGQGVVVGNAGWEARLEENKQAYALEFVQSQRFVLNYPPLLSASAFVDRLRANTGASLSQGERDSLVSELTNNNTNAGRASVLRKVAEDADLQTAEKNRAYVLMQYFGYLRRNPNDPPNADYSGWKFWLDKLNLFGGDAVAAEMVKAFIRSDEYRQRFGP